MNDRGKYIIKEPFFHTKLKNILNLGDIYTLIVLGVYTLFDVILMFSIENAWQWMLYNLLIAGTVLSIATLDSMINSGKFFHLFRRLYIVAVVFFIYSQGQVYIRAFNPRLYDGVLMGWDQALFGVNPTEWMKQFITPVLTEYLQFAYVTFFFLPVIHGVELYLKKRDDDFINLIGIIVFSFYFSYLLYFFLPAIGPRFSLHGFFVTNTEMPGIWLTDFFRNFVNSGGGIPDGAARPEFYVNRDCMPSGHTWITLVNIYMAYKFKVKTRWLFYILGFSLIFATIYLRYHYVVDVMAGIVFAVVTILIEPRLKGVFKKRGFTKL